MADDPFADLPDVRYQARPPAALAAAGDDPFADLPDTRYKAPAPKGDNLLVGTLRAAGQGVTFGFADELRAAARATARRVAGNAGDWSQAYDEELAQDRGRVQQFEDQHPVASIAGNVAGGMLMPLGAAGAAKSVIGAVGRGAAAGAGTGAVSGFGSAEGGVANRATGAVIGGAVGAGLGGVAGGAVKAGAGALGRFTPGGAQRQGQAVLRNALQAEDVSPDEIAARIQRANASGVTGVTIGDVATSGPVRALAEDVLHHPNTNQGAYAGMLAKRHTGERTAQGYTGDAAQGVETDVRKALKIERQRAFATAQQLAESRKAAAEGLFGQARQVDITRDPQVASAWQAAIDTDFGEDALGSTRKLWRARYPKQPFPLDDQQNLSAVPNMEVMQMFKEGLDDAVSRAFKNDGYNVGKAAEAVRSQLVGALDEANPFYAQARAQYAGDKALEEALEKGRGAFKTPADEVEATLAGMTPGEQEQFRIGAATALSDGRKVGPATRATDFLLKDRDNFRRVMALVPDDESRELLMQQLTVRQGMDDLASRMGGSPTSRRLKAADLMEGGEGVQEVPETLIGVAKWLVRKTVGRVGDKALEARRAEAGRLLMQQDSAALQALRNVPMGPTGPERAPAQMGARLGNMAGRVAGSLLEMPGGPVAQQPQPPYGGTLWGMPGDEDWPELNAGNGAALRIR
jgi:hypothetical protein